MKRYVIVIVLLLFSCWVTAEQLRELPALGKEQSTLRIFGAADYAVIVPLFNAFQERYTWVSIEYTEFNTRRLYQHFLDSYPVGPDLMLSSAMDLQIKLVNDGFAQPYRSTETAALPGWANWRDEIFGFTYEPAVIAVNRRLLAGEEVPSNRIELLDMVRRNSDHFRGRIGTFDIANVGVGYLTWSHDSQQSGSYGRLLESFGNHDARLFNSSADMLQALSNREIAIAYNLLGSYAYGWAKNHPEIEVVLPTDYTSLVMRSAFVPKKAANSVDAKRFLDFLLSHDGQQLLADRSNLYPILEDVSGETTAQSLRLSSRSPLRPIPLGLNLLIQTDQASRRALLLEWELAIKGDDTDE